VQAGADVNETDANGMTPLKQACAYGRADLVELLLGAGAEVNPAPHPVGPPPLLWAASVSAAIARRLLDAGANPAAVSAMGMGALHHGALSQQADEVVPLLLAAGVPCCVDRFGQTPLHAAARSGHVGAVVALVAAGEPIDARDGSGQTPFLNACQALQPDRAIALAESLATAKADVRVLDTTGRSALYLACAGEGRIDLLRLLCEKHGLDPNAPRVPFGDTPVLECVRRGDLTMLEYLVARGGDIRAVDQQGATALHYVTHRGDDHGVPIAQWLAARGANLNAVNQFGRTPLATLLDVHPNTFRNDEARRRMAALAEILLALGASVDEKSRPLLNALESSSAKPKTSAKAKTSANAKTSAKAKTSTKPKPTPKRRK
jgi:cytohesin